jgi:hypothetical protein
MTLFDNYTSLYFYSAVFQGNAALLAFAAVFVVFKLQVLSQSLQSNETSIATFARDHFAMNSAQVFEPIRAKFTDVEAILPEIDKLLTDPAYGQTRHNIIQSLRSNTTFVALIGEHKIVKSKRSQLIAEVRKPFVQLLIVMIISLLLLPISNFVHSLGVWIEAGFIAFTILLNVVALVTNTMFVFRALKN